MKKSSFIKRYKTPALGILASVTMMWGAKNAFNVPYDQMWEAFEPVLIGFGVVVGIAFFVGALLRWVRSRTL